MKKLKRKSIAKTAPKTKEKEIVERAKKLFQNPLLIVPYPLDAKSEKPISKLRKEIEKLNEIKEDVKRLEKLSKKKGLVGALAGTLLIAHSEKAPYLALAKMGKRNIMYAIRGKADREMLISFQYFDDPVLRLLGFKSFVIKNKLILYSWDNRFVCTDKDNIVPDEFLEFVIKKLDLKRDNDCACCRHLTSDMLNGKERPNTDYIKIKWKNVTIGVCKECGRERNTFIEISKHFIDPLLKDHLSLEVILSVSKEAQRYYTDEYLFGSISTDAALINKNLEEWKKSLRGKVFILKDKNFRKDMESFIDALKPNEIEKRALRIILSRIEEPIIADEASASKVLNTYWKRFGRDVLEHFTKDKELAEELYSYDYPPSKILEIAWDLMEKKEKLSRYPSFATMPPVAKFVDKLVKTYVLFGKDKVISMLSRPPENVKERAIAYAFLLALGKGADRKWQYTKVEQEYGEYLKEFVEKLLNSSPERYRENLNALLAASGLEEKV